MTTPSGNNPALAEERQDDLILLSHPSQVIKPEWKRCPDVTLQGEVETLTNQKGTHPTEDLAQALEQDGVSEAWCEHLSAPGKKSRIPGEFRALCFEDVTASLRHTRGQRDAQVTTMHLYRAT